MIPAIRIVTSIFPNFVNIRIRLKGKGHDFVIDRDHEEKYVL